MSLLRHRAPGPPAPPSPRLRIQAEDSLFCDAFVLSYRSFCHEYQQDPLTDDAICGYIRLVMHHHVPTSDWKAGELAGWFAALYHLPCAFDAPDTPPPPRLPAPIDLHIIEPRFASCYAQGYQQARRQFGDQPATPEQLFQVIREAYWHYNAHATLTTGRCCAGYLSGWFAGFYGVRSFIPETLLAEGSALLHEGRTR